jgi:hypothetical protein
VSRIWQVACAASDGHPPTLLPVSGTLLRVVESQEQVATNAIVDSAAEQHMLEQLLERTKPVARAGSERAHYLLQAPFRYPPLAHGSRFGSRFEPSIFYGSRQEPTVLAEGAFYRFWFWHGMSRPPAKPLRTQHTIFKAGYRTARGIRLQDPPFSTHADILRDPCDYRETQALGTAMRAAACEAFEYVSARDPQGGLNVGLFQPQALSPLDRILARQEWSCTTGPARVMFYNPARRATREFPLDLYLVDGAFPVPAA